MRRLAIIDVAGGQQPIYNETETLAIVCNGEIYNHSALRRDLEHAGHRFRTHSDVEVILHLYEDLSERCFEKLNGMFSIALADFENDRLVLARDPFGQKPLYVHRQSSGWAFASELKALTTLPGFVKQVSSAATAAFLQFRYVPAPLTIFENVQKLKPGSYCVIDRTGTLRNGRYFQIDLSPAIERRQDPHGTATRETLAAAVERHLMSERPLGVFLSGGFDSSAIVACMHMNGHRDIRTFTVGFEDFGENELDTGRAVAALFKTNHHEVVLGPEMFWESLDEVSYSVDEPLADLTTVPLYHLARAASKEVVVVLSGEGADELLAGYEGLETLRARFDRHGRFRSLSLLARALLPLPLPDSLTDKLQTISGSAAEYLARTQATVTSVFPSDYRREFFSSGLSESSVMEPLERYYRERQTWDGLNLYLGAMIEWWLPDDILHKSDRMTMAHSLELRCPFLDVQFAMHAANLDLDSKINSKSVGGWHQKIALKAGFKHLLPTGLAMQKKRGFPIPIYQWLENVYKDRARTELEREAAFGTSLLSRSARQDLFAAAVGGNLISQRRVWSLIMLNRWGDRWL